MPSPLLSTDETRALLAHLLAGAAGRDEAHWLRLVSIERVHLADNLRTNWRLETKARGQDRAAIDSAEAIVRDAHPYVRW